MELIDNVNSDGHSAHLYFAAQKISNHKSFLCKSDRLKVKHGINLLPLVI